MTGNERKVKTNRQITLILVLLVPVVGVGTVVVVRGKDCDTVTNPCDSTADGSLEADDKLDRLLRALIPVVLGVVGGGGSGSFALIKRGRKEGRKVERVGFRPHARKKKKPR